MSLQISLCRTCSAQVYWVVTENGKKMPVDALPREDGNIVFVGEKAHVLKRDEPVAEGTRRYVSHFVTCRQAGEHRRKRA